MRAVISSQLDQLRLSFVLNLIAWVILNFSFGIWFSHRVAGPLHRLQRHMADISEGKTVSDLKFREGDYFPELADQFNKQHNELVKTLTSK